MFLFWIESWHEQQINYLKKKKKFFDSTVNDHEGWGPLYDPRRPLHLLEKKILKKKKIFFNNNISHT